MTDLRISLNPAKVMAIFANKVARWQVPDKVLFVDELSRTASGKLRKARLRERFAEALADWDLGAPT